MIELNIKIDFASLKNKKNKKHTIMVQQVAVSYQVSSDNLYSEIGSEAVILELKSGVYYGLNETGNQIWQWLQEPKTESEIISLVLEEYDVTPEQGTRDVKALLQEMIESEIIQIVQR